MMSLFQIPPATRYDLNFTLGKIPVRIHPFFWLITALFGLSGGLPGLLVWIVVVLVSLLVHELGHVLMMRRFSVPASILLYASGGLAIPEPVWWGGVADVSLRPSEQIQVSLAGPFAGFALAALTLGLVALTGGTIGANWLLGFIPVPVARLPEAGWVVNAFISALLSVNVFWGLLNLVPVYPLDGGQAARAFLTQLNPGNGIRFSQQLSLAAAVLMALLGLVYFRSAYLAFMFGFLAYESYRAQSYRF